KASRISHVSFPNGTAAAKRENWRRANKSQPNCADAKPFGNNSRALILRRSVRMGYKTWDCLNLAHVTAISCPRLHRRAFDCFAAGGRGDAVPACPYP